MKPSENRRYTVQLMLCGLARDLKQAALAAQAFDFASPAYGGNETSIRSEVDVREVLRTLRHVHSCLGVVLEAVENLPSEAGAKQPKDHVRYVPMAPSKGRGGFYPKTDEEVEADAVRKEPRPWRKSDGQWGTTHPLPFSPTWGNVTPVECDPSDEEE